MSDPQQPLEDLGSEFEILPDDPKTSPASRPAQSPSAPAAPLISSADAWGSLGLTVALAGLLSSWGDAESRLAVLRGLLTAGALFHLFTGGLATVQPTGRRLKAVLPGLLVLAGVVALVLIGSFAPGPVFTLLGGLLALGAPSLGAKKDASPPPPPRRPLDPQFSSSFGAYLVAVVGILMPWCGSDQSGVDSLFGVITLFFLLVTMWASWVGSFRLWTMPVVTGKLGFFLFLAPLEVAILGGIGVMRHLLSFESLRFAYEAWPAAADGSGEGFLEYGAGPLLTLGGGLLALVILVRGAKTASAMARERKVAEAEARKAARAARKGK